LKRSRQRVAACAGQRPASHVGGVHEAVVLEHLLEQIVCRKKGVEDEREEGTLRQQRYEPAAERGLAASDIAGHDNQPFAPAQRVNDGFQGALGGRRRGHELGSGSEAERRLPEAIVIYGTVLLTAL